MAAMNTAIVGMIPEYRNEKKKMDLAQRACERWEMHMGLALSEGSLRVADPYSSAAFIANISFSPPFPSFSGRTGFKTHHNAHAVNLLALFLAPHILSAARGDRP